jgi:hypothetical protein
MRNFSIISVVLLSSTGTGNVRAATQPHALRGAEATATWTNDDLAQLHRIPGLISIVGNTSNVAFQSAEASAPQPQESDPAWYAAQARWLNAQLEAEQAQLHDYVQALDDTRAGTATMSGVSLDQQHIGLTPEATIDILKSRIRQTQSELDALQDFARRNDIEPGILRGQGQSGPDDTAVNATDELRSDLSAHGGDL